MANDPLTNRNETERENTMKQIRNITVRINKDQMGDSRSMINSVERSLRAAGRDKNDRIDFLNEAASAQDYDQLIEVLDRWVCLEVRS